MVNFVKLHRYFFIFLPNFLFAIQDIKILCTSLENVLVSKAANVPTYHRYAALTEHETTNPISLF
jgi:hypothetical protein